MPCRAKISVLLTLVGVLNAAGAPLNPAQKNTAFQPGGKAAVSKAKVVKPSKDSRWHRPASLTGVKVQTITPASRPEAEVEVNGFVFHRAAEAPAAKVPAVKAAGGAH